MKRLFVISLFLLVCQTAFAQSNDKAGIVVFPSFVFSSDSSVNESSRNHFLFDFRSGYINDAGLYFGVLFTSMTGNGSNYSVNQTTLGNSFGYFLGNFGAILSLHLTAKRKEKSLAQTVTLSEGIGFQFDFLYLVPLSSWFSLDLILSYRNINFDKQQISGGNLQAVSQNTSNFSPFLGFLIHF